MYNFELFLIFHQFRQLSQEILEETYTLQTIINPLNAELNLICYFLALLGADHFLHVSRISVKSLTLRLLMSYIYICIYIYIHIYSKTCLKRNAIIPVFFSVFTGFRFTKGLCFNKTKYKKYDRLGLQ